MSGNHIIASIILGLSILGGSYLYTKKSLVISTNSATHGTIQVTGQGKSKAIPDTVLLNLGVEVKNTSTQKDAMNQMNESISQIKTILKRVDIEEKNIQTSDLFAGENFTWTDGKRILDGYRASQNLTIRIEKKEKAATDMIIDEVGKVPHIRINNIGYDILDTTAAYTEARKMALQKARQKADEIAKETGVKIQEVQSVSEGSSNNIGQYRMNALTKGVMAMENQSSDISVGQVEYSVTLNVVYKIK